jgi:hypothetical protein
MGSYRLSSNLTVSDPDLSVIEITTDNVTIDLNGFTILGPRDICSNPIVPTWCFGIPLPTGVGVIGREAAAPTTTPIHGNIAVYNGTVRAMGSHGIFLGDSTRVERVLSELNGGIGIRGGVGSQVNYNIVRENRDRGIFAPGGLAIGNNVRGNASFGLAAFGYATNILRNNNSGGVQVDSGIQVGPNLCDTSPCP